MRSAAGRGILGVSIAEWLEARALQQGRGYLAFPLPPHLGSVFLLPGRRPPQFPITPAVADVIGPCWRWPRTQAWVDAREGHFGWLGLGNEQRTQTSKRFHSREPGNARNRAWLGLESPVPAGDVNKHCRVDLTDIAMLASNWLVDGETLALELSCVRA